MYGVPLPLYCPLAVFVFENDILYRYTLYSTVILGIPCDSPQKSYKLLLGM